MDLVAAFNEHYFQLISVYSSWFAVYKYLTLCAAPYIKLCITCCGFALCGSEVATFYSRCWRIISERFFSVFWYISLRRKCKKCTRFDWSWLLKETNRRELSWRIRVHPCCRPSQWRYVHDVKTRKSKVKSCRKLLEQSTDSWATTDWH